MPLLLFRDPSFSRSLKKLGHNQLIIIARILEALEVYYASNMDLSKGKEIAPRFFYKQLRKPYYEAGVEGNLRVLLRRDGSEVRADLAGNHDQIKQFLKSM